MGGGIALAFAGWQPARVASLTLIASAHLGPEINGDFITGFVRAQRRRELQEVLALLVHDPALVSRAMVEDVLRYKRLDGVAAALATIAEEWFPNGTQRVGNGALAAGLPLPVQLIWGGDDRIIPRAHAEALAEKLPVHILDAAGHLPHMEKSGEVNRLIGRFIEDERCLWSGQVAACAARFATNPRAIRCFRCNAIAATASARPGAHTSRRCACRRSVFASPRARRSNTSATRTAATR
jgi:alpha-beta hydrolase superfamily lysophospholipase